MMNTTVRQSKTWKMITPTQIAKSASGAAIKLSCNTSCKTTNVVCLIPYTKCGKQYVGETGDHVNQRMNGHWDDWKHKRFERYPVAEHFCSPEHDFLNHAALCCLDHKPEWTDRTRKARESYWIRRLDTLRPSLSTRATSRGNHRSFVRVCDSLHGTFCSCDVPELQRKLGPFALSIDEKHTVGVYPFRCKVYGALYTLRIWAQWCWQENKLFTFCTLCLSRNVYISHIPKHAQLSSRSGLDNMGPKRA